jgi:hypothetical protein
LDVLKLNELNGFQEPAHHCPLSSYRFTVQEEGRILPIYGIMTQLPFNLTGFNPFTVYMWRLVHNNNIILRGSTTTLEAGKLRHFFIY